MLRINLKKPHSECFYSKESNNSNSEAEGN